MDVQNFVAETLRQIAGGVAQARDEIARMENGAQINPHGGMRLPATTSVEFDMAVTVAVSSQDGASSKAGGSVGVLAVFSAKANAGIAENSGNGERNDEVSRVKFSVPLRLPGYDVSG